jgi:hypothetical protein
MLFDTLLSTFYVQICSIKNPIQGIAMNGRYHQPPKVVIRSPHMPTLCIDNAKYMTICKHFDVIQDALE